MSSRNVFKPVDIKPNSENENDINDFLTEDFQKIVPTKKIQDFGN